MSALARADAPTIDAVTGQLGGRALIHAGEASHVARPRCGQMQRRLQTVAAIRPPMACPS